MRFGYKIEAKLDEDNIFSEGTSRKRVKPTYRGKSDITDKREDHEWNTVENFSNGKGDSFMKKKRKEEMEKRPSPPPKKRNPARNNPSKKSVRLLPATLPITCARVFPFSNCRGKASETATPTMKRKKGNTRSVGVQPCQAACRKGG